LVVVPFLVRMSWWTPECLPDGRRQAGDRHLNFHKGRDNLPSKAPNTLKGAPWAYGVTLTSTRGYVRQAVQ